jgi:Domain of unknown function (DUF4336)
VSDSRQVSSQDRSWRYWFTLPIYPYDNRRTIRQEVLADTIWTFEQVQGIFYVVVPIRMTVVRCSEGGLLVYAPVAPTLECVKLLNELVERYGDVRYIILPTISGLEHKVFVGPFARCFPQAQVWVTPDQWSFPIDLPLSWLGLPSDRTHILSDDSSKTPFGDEFDYAILETIDLGPGQFAEVAFYHKRSRTLLVTDAIISIPVTPPKIVAVDPYPLLFHARDKSNDAILPSCSVQLAEPLGEKEERGSANNNTITQQMKGWQRICLFALYFRPSSLEIPKWSHVFRESLTALDRSRKGYFGLYPFRWRSGWEGAFDILRQNGRLLVAPILQTVILNRNPKGTIEWIDRVCEWDFERIIPCHFDAPIAATPIDFRTAFDFLEDPAKLRSGLPATDFQLIEQIEGTLTWWRIIYPDRS